MPIYNPYNGLEYQIGSDYLDAIEYPHEYKTYLEVQVWKFSSNMPSKTEIFYYSDLTDNVISGSFNYDNSSDIKRSCTLNMAVKNNELLVNKNSNIWFDKAFKIYNHYEYPNDNREDEKLFLGWFLPNKNSFVYDENGRSLTIGCDDIITLLMNTRCGAMLDWGEYSSVDSDNDVFLSYCGLIIEGARGLDEVNIDNNLAAIIKNLLKQCKLPLNFDSNKIIPMLKESYLEIPYDLEFSADQSLYDVLKTLVDLIPNQRMYITEDLNLIFDYMPNIWLYTATESHYVYHRSRDLTNIVISESNEQNLTDFYNYVVVMGKDGVAGKYAIQQGGYCLYCGNKYTRAEYKSNEYCPFCLEEYGLRKSIYYMNENHPLTIENVGVFKKAIENESCSTIQECRNMARWECIKSSNLQNSITIAFVDFPIKFLYNWGLSGLGEKIEYTSIITGETNVYIVNKVSYDSESCIWTADLSRFYALQEEPIVTVIGAPPSYVGHYDLKKPTFTYELGINGLCTFHINNGDHTEWSLFKIYVNDKFVGETVTEENDRTSKVFIYQFSANNDYRIYTSAYNPNFPPSISSDNQIITIDNIVTPKTVDNDPYPHTPIEIIDAHAPRIIDEYGNFITDENGDYILYT